MLTYNMEARGDDTRYGYLYRCIKDDIVDGRIAAGTRLPSKRKLAEHLGVGVVTVEGAYRQLVAEGFVEARERSGYYAVDLGESDGKSRAFPRYRIGSERGDVAALDTFPYAPRQRGERDGLIADLTGKTYDCFVIICEGPWSKQVRLPCGTVLCANRSR